MYQLSPIKIKGTNEVLPVYVKKSNTIYVKKQGQELQLAFVVSKPKIHLCNVENRLGNLVCEWSYSQYKKSQIEIKNNYLFLTLTKKEIKYAI